MVLCLGEPPGGFCDVGCCCCFFTSLEVFHFIAFRHHPSPFRGLSPGFYTHFILSAQPIADWFVTLSFSTIPLSSYRERYNFEWAFFTHRRYLSYAPSPTFYLRLSRPPWEPAVLPWSLQGFMLILETQTDPSACLIHSNSQSSYSELISKFYQTLSWITCGESLIYLLLTCFELFSLIQSHM